jgi:hypothetical protein
MRYYLSFLLLLCVACEIPIASNSNNNSLEIDTVTTHPWIQNAVKHFYPLLDTPIIIDENRFFFIQNQKWDTSFAIIMKRESTKVYGAYHEVLPQNDLSYINGKQLLFEQVIRFESDTVTWNSIVTTSDSLLKLSFNWDYAPFCGEASYTMAYNHKAAFSDSKTSRLFYIYADFLKREVVNPMKKLKD